MNILLIDDEPGLCGLISIILEKGGHQPFAAARGDQAMALFNGHHIDLVISDVLIGSDNGPALANVMGKQRPGLAVLFMSGYASDFSDQSVDQGIRHAFLGKPFTAAELMTAIGQLGETAQAAAA